MLRQAKDDRGKAPNSRNASDSSESGLPLDTFEIIEHDIEPSNTLQGIAIKYRTTVDSLKKLNKIYANDELHGRKVLKVRVIKHGILHEEAIKKKEEFEKGDLDLLESGGGGSVDEGDGKNGLSLLDRVDKELSSSRRNIDEITAETDVPDTTWSMSAMPARFRQSFQDGISISNTAIVILLVLFALVAPLLLYYYVWYEEHQVHHVHHNR
eukprot:Clim_evm89s207 gene=Clim_evmTU89s207